MKGLKVYAGVRHSAAAWVKKKKSAHPIKKTKQKNPTLHVLLMSLNSHLKS